MEELLVEMKRCISLLDATIAIAKDNAAKRAEVYRLVATNPATLLAAGVEL